MRACRLPLLVLLALGFCPLPAVGQSTQPAEAQTPKAPPAVEASQLDTFLMRDSKGNLVPVLGLPFEEFERLLRAKKGLNGPAAPSHTIESLSLVGTASEEMVDLQVTATIRVRQPGWERVPLNLGTAAIRQPSKYKGPGEHFLAYDDAAGGYACWLKGDGAEPHVVTLQISVGLNTLGEDRTLSLMIPRATESSLRVSTPLPNVEASLTRGEGIATTRASGAGRSEITVLGPAGDLRLSWRPLHRNALGRASQIDASGEIAIRVLSERRITSEARLRVRSNGSPLESFRVRLPAGMELISAPITGGYSVTLVDADPEESAEVLERLATQTVEVRLERPGVGPTEIVLRAQCEADLGPGGSLRPAQFEILDAVRQRGSIDFLVDGEWQLDWSEDNTVHRIDPPTDTSTNVVARFEYFRQPCGLELSVAPRPSRVTVEPTHTVFVDPERVRVETTLKYRFRGARAAGLSFDLSDWTFDRLTPDALLDVPVVGSANASEVRVPFRSGGAPLAELELKLEAHRAFSFSTDKLSLTFPRPLADFVAPATIVISPADSIEMTPQVAELIGLTQDPASTRLAARQQPPVVYRDLGGGEEAMFVANLRKLARATSTSVRGTVRIDRQQMQIEQQLDYRIAHVSQRTFVLTVPRGVASSGGLQVWINGEPLTATMLPANASHDPALTRWQFTTPTDQIGAFQAVVRYSLPLDWDRKAALPLAIPHVLPADEENQFSGQRLEFIVSDGSTIEPDLEGVEELSEPIAVGSGTAHAYSWSSPTSFSHWTLELGLGAEPSSVSVAQMWVQSWLTPQVRQERVAIRLSTTQEAVRIRLPKRVRQASVQTAIDGREVEGNFRVPGLLVVAMPAHALGRECVLEVSYALDPPEQHWGLMNDVLQTAQVDQAAAPRRVYWQLALPEDLHLVVPPEALAPEMTWSVGRPAGWFAARRPVMDQTQLEAWIKASRQESLPQGANEYLFGGLGRWPALSVVTAHRRLVVTLASGCILAAGLLLVHVRRLRSPGVLWTAAVLLAGITIAVPDLGLLAAQAAVLGVLVLTAVMAWTWFSSGRVILRTPSVSTAAGRSRESSSVYGPSQRPERSSRITTTAGAGPLLESRP